MDGVFLENGPFRIESDGASLSMESHSWHNLANVLYIDQPIGTGLSYAGPSTNGKPPHNSTATNQQLYTFLQRWFVRHPEYTFLSVAGTATTTSTVPLFFSGESYAGHYIPSIGDYIVSQNKAIVLGLLGLGEPNDNIAIDLSGLAIGNGWTHPRIQYNYAPFAHAQGLLSASQHETLLKRYREECIPELDASDGLSNDICQSIVGDIIANSGTCVPGVKDCGGGHKVNMYGEADKGGVGQPTNQPLHSTPLLSSSNPPIPTPTPQPHAQTCASTR